SYEYVVAYENDRRNPKEDTLEEMAKILGTSSDYLKYGFIRRSYVSDDKMYEFEYRDLPSNETNAKENISKINEYIDAMKKYKKYESVNYLQILEDIAQHLYTDSMTDAIKAVPEEFEDLTEQLLTYDEYVKALKKK
ncbi:MAG: helix-turn-helix transcriptional regulator, partial [Erysipelotrichaceae bacterium]|nr:helix-turn-helix transcriptional regulator [Erysipelotrichaceae bacterium]